MSPELKAYLWDLVCVDDGENCTGPVYVEARALLATS